LLHPIALVGDVTPYEALLSTGREISRICELPGHASGAVHDGITADPIDWRLHLFKVKAVSGVSNGVSVGGKNRPISER
jgi:hypothetical protein